MKLRAQALLSTGKINREKGIVEGVAVITQGAAKGHGMLIDSQTTDSVLRAVDKYTSGVKVKFNPDTFNHGDGSIVGLLPKESFRKDGEVLRADFHIEETYQNKDYVFNLIEKMGDTFGLSIDFECSAENIGGVDFARCGEIYAATIVDQPAANPNGFWSIEPKQNQNPSNNNVNDMNKEELASILTEALKPINTAVEGLKADVSAVKADFASYKSETAPVDLSQVSKEEMAAAGFEEKDDEETKMRKLRAFRKDAGKPLTHGDLKKAMTGFVREVGAGGAAAGSSSPATGGANGNMKGQATTAFMAKVDEVMVATGSKHRGPAIATVAKNFPEIHTAYLKEVGVSKGKDS